MTPCELSAVYDSNHGKPFYVDVGTSVVAIRCASNHDVVLSYDHTRMPHAIELAENACDRMNREAEIHNSGDVAELPKTVDTRFDICKDIALVLKIGRDFQNKDGFRGAHYDTVKLLCDAIEYQQEQLKAKTEVCDAAKLRKVLTEILEYIDSFHKYITPGKGKKLTALFAVADTVRNKARAALAAPPRNCDKYPTFNDAIRALADKRGWHDAKWDSERYCILASWLFAPATEKEGGNNADK